MLFSIIHSSGINNIFGAGVNNIDERTRCFQLFKEPLRKLVKGQKNLNLTPTNIPVLLGYCRCFEKQIEKQQSTESEGKKQNGFLAWFLSLK